MLRPLQRCVDLLLFILLRVPGWYQKESTINNRYCLTINQSIERYVALVNNAKEIGHEKRIYFLVVFLVAVLALVAFFLGAAFLAGAFLVVACTIIKKMNVRYVENVIPK